ncbi:3-chlorobenzoate-3,4-dioxygenase oxygenase subunit [Trachymyrmex cornetzi]|uniref:cholesterol 7-desaturase n=1 Tax=Trachymyrmex cornetzi TaxID=471704 RepID=A0A195EHX2_9HYME|nr:3-chlorobenzoate-3,4-dioxygenase oxygenase subunit [Trachymyrmex cornetzi]
MLEWCVGIATTLLIFLIYFAYFFKFNWVKFKIITWYFLKDMRAETKTQQLRNFYMSNKHRKGKLPPVYPNGWFALLESSQIKSGQVKHVSALGENFAVFRTEKGDVNILDAYCPHLGANMAEGGRVKGDCLECPFHNWTFRGEDGYCENIPYTEKVPHIARAKVWKSCEVNHIIFVWYHSESAEPDWQPQPYTCISNGSWRYQGRNEYLVNSHIQDITENGSDSTHLNALHGPETIKTSAKLKNQMRASIHSIENDKGNDHFVISQNSSKERHKVSVHVGHKLILLERFSVMEVDIYAEQIGPGYVEMTFNTSIGSMCILFIITPVEPLLQRVIHLIFSPPLLAPYANLIFLGDRVMFERDIRIWNSKKFEQHPILVREDRTIQVFRRWYSQFYSDHSPTYQMAMKDLQW